MGKLVINGKEQLKSYAGKELATSDWYTVTFEDIKRFADATGDHQWIHVDRERAAKESPFGAPIAHGYFTLSRVAGIFLDMVEFKGFAMAINYGLNKVRFPAPLKEGKRYRLKAEMQGVEDVTNGIETVFKMTMEIENEPKPAMVAEVVFRYFG